MKGIVLALLGFFLAVVSAAAAGDSDFVVTNDVFVTRDPAAIIRPVQKTSDPLVRLVTDDRIEALGRKPSIAFTVVRFTAKSAEVSLQPIAGPINGAQVQVSF
jgi:hypothetical protein